MPTLVFSDDFESGNTSKWPAAGTFDRGVVVTTAKDGKPPFAGSKQLETNWDGTVAWNDPKTYSSLNLPDWPYTNETLVRLRYRLAADVDAKFGAKMLRMGKYAPQ